MDNPKPPSSGFPDRCLEPRQRQRHHSAILGRRWFAMANISSIARRWTPGASEGLRFQADY
jgi:hypothetical protein